MKTDYSQDNLRVTYSTEVERLYVNDDLENGLANISISFAVRKSTTDHKTMKVYVQIYSISSGSKETPIPRKLILNNWKSLEASAKIQTTYAREAKIESCVFDLTPDLLDWIKSNEILYMSVIDPVQNRTITFNVNGRIIQNQATCIRQLID
ncbi:MAG: hypothetical protein EKK39_02115 [Sphingobacteriales bacterium]|nr:MAG: hypothetical protein EKK39_02115 [Sphingobacteriales bacterium]